MPTEAPRGIETAELNVSGMHCEACVNRVRRHLMKIHGVQAADVDLAAGRATVMYRSDAVTRDSITSAIADAGYEATFLEIQSSGQ